MSENKTIFSLSSGPPPAGVAVLRISGTRANAALAALTHTPSLPPLRRASLMTLYHPASGVPIDDALVIRFAGPASFTGEDSVELHVTGGPSVVAAALDALGSINGLRLARAGEFARRAFDNEKLDLTQAEGLADLIEAQTEGQRLQALRMASGGLKDLAERWRADLVTCLAECEAALDFGEEESDVSSEMLGEQDAPIRALHDDITAHLDRAKFGERLRRGLSIIVLGAPNVGKSSLINALARRDVAIVSPQAGTTRDLIEVQLDLGGVPATLIDTAGLRETGNVIEAEGVRRAKARAAEADIILHLCKPGDRVPEGAIAVYPKADLRPAQAAHGSGFHVSSLTGVGLGALESALLARAAELTGRGEDAIVARERQRVALAACVDHLADARAEPDHVLRTENLRLALRALGELTGRVGVEDILDQIFGRFCIGK